MVFLVSLQIFTLLISACTFWLLAYGEAAVKNGVINVSLYRAELRPVLIAGDNERNSIRANEITVTLQWSLSVLHSLLPSQTSQSAAFPETHNWQDVLYSACICVGWFCPLLYVFYVYLNSYSCCFSDSVGVFLHYTRISIKTSVSYLQTRTIC